jgi:hypothetical protein
MEHSSISSVVFKRNVIGIKINHNPEKRMSAPPPTPQTAPSSAPPLMKGGAREQLLDIVKKYAQPLEFYFGVLIVLGIIYVGQIPDRITYQANTLIGRLFLFSFTILIADMYSWVYALLMALFTVLLISVAPRTVREGFQMIKEAMSDMDVKLVTQKERWWVERVLRENPLGIEEEKVRTDAIQDSGNPSNSMTSSTGR